MRVSFKHLVFQIVLILSLFAPAAKAADSLSDYLSAVEGIAIDDLRSSMLEIWAQGLNPKKYWTDDMELTYQKGDSSNPIFKDRAKRNFLAMLSDLSVGSVDPAYIGPDVKFDRKRFISARYLMALVNGSGQKAYLVVSAMAPQNPPYEALKMALQRVYPKCADGSWVALTPQKKPLKLNSKNKVLVDLKKRLAILGYRMNSYDEVFDRDVLAAINDIQWNLRWTPDGVISPRGRTWNFLNVSCKDRVRQLQADMEKMRWFPQSFEERYIFINLAMAYFGLVDKDPSASTMMSFRTINGRTERKSPTMRDSLVTVILNPFWVVPPTIFVQDKVEEIKKLPSWEVNQYFNSHNYEVWNKNFTRRLDPASINWWGIDENSDVDIYIRQRPNYLNALGVVKFELTNSFSIYLHDTNQRELFVQPNRLLSSGCIRLERPLDLAEYLLRGTEWTRPMIEATVAKPGQVMTKDTRIPLKRPIPVYTAYLTSLMSSDGVIRFTEDSYGQNKKIMQTMGAPF
ncbi:MAG: murein L,D-transpeptidase [Bdellovibrio sp.]